MKTFLALIILISTSHAFAFSADNLTVLHVCTVTKDYVMSDMRWPDVGVGVTSDVIVYSNSEEPGSLVILIGDTLISTSDDDLAKEISSLGGKSYSAMPNSGEWLVVLEIVGKKGVLNYMPVNGDRQSFQKQADLECE